MNFSGGIGENILGLIIWVALIYAVFRLLTESIYAVLRIALAIFIAAEIIYFLQLWIDIPFLDRISWDLIEKLNLQIVKLFNAIFNFGQTTVKNLNIQSQ